MDEDILKKYFAPALLTACIASGIFMLSRGIAHFYKQGVNLSKEYSKLSDENVELGNQLFGLKSENLQLEDKINQLEKDNKKINGENESLLQENKEIEKNYSLTFRLSQSYERMIKNALLGRYQEKTFGSSEVLRGIIQHYRFICIVEDAFSEKEDSQELYQEIQIYKDEVVKNIVRQREDSLVAVKNLICYTVQGDGKDLAIDEESVSDTYSVAMYYVEQATTIIQEEEIKKEY